MRIEQKVTAAMKPRILFVEDEAALRTHLAEALSDEYQIETASNGAEALRVVMRARPELIVTDIVMPEMDGVELLKTLRSVSSTKAIPVLLISGHAAEDQRLEGFHEGADGYLSKPYSERELRALIGSMILSARQRAEHIRSETLKEADRRAMSERAALLESITDAFYALDGQYRFTYVNQRALDYYGHTREELLGRSIWDAFPVGERSLLQGQFEQVLRTQEPTTFEVRSLITDRWNELRVYPAGEGVSVYLRDVSDRRHAEQELRAALIRLREADQRKDEFLALLSHELRNPLAPIAHGLAFLQARSPAEPDLQRTLASMDRQLTHMLRLINDLLDVRRITNGALQLHRQHIPLGDVLANAAEACRPVLESRKHSLTLDGQTRDLILNVDRDRLQQVFTNLIHNSAKYTDPGGTIRVTVSRDSEHAIVSIADTGIGLAANDLDRVFEMFTQVRAQQTQAGGGLGIGLALVRQVVQMHGGTVHAASPGLGLGSTFTVCLPLAHGPIYAVPTEVPESEPPAGNRRALRVLVVDDNEDVATSLGDVLRLKGNNVLTAASGEEAVELARGFRPDLIFMDIGLPGIDGVEAARRISAEPELRHARIVALTGWGQPMDRARTAAAGMVAHLLKPVAPDCLERTLAKFSAPENVANAADGGGLRKGGSAT